MRTSTYRIAQTPFRDLHQLKTEALSDKEKSIILWFMSFSEQYKQSDLDRFSKHVTYELSRHNRCALPKGEYIDLSTTIDLRILILDVWKKSDKMSFVPLMTDFQVSEPPSIECVSEDNLVSSPPISILHDVKASLVFPKKKPKKVRFVPRVVRGVKSSHTRPQSRVHKAHSLFPQSGKEIPTSARESEILKLRRLLKDIQVLLNEYFEEDEEDSKSSRELPKELQPTDVQHISGSMTQQETPKVQSRNLGNIFPNSMNASTPHSQPIFKGSDRRNAQVGPSLEKQQTDLVWKQGFMSFQ